MVVLVAQRSFPLQHHSRARSCRTCTRVGKGFKMAALARRVSSSVCFALHSAECTAGQTFHWIVCHPVQQTLPVHRSGERATHPITRIWTPWLLHRRLVCSIGSGWNFRRMPPTSWSLLASFCHSVPSAYERPPTWPMFKAALACRFRYSRNKYPQTATTTNVQRQDQSFHSRLSSAFIVSLFTHGQLSVQVRFYINVYLGTIPLGYLT